MVSPSIANGVVALVVNVTFVGYGGWEFADQATDHPKLNSKTINNAFKTFAFIILLLVFLRPIKLNQFATQPFNFFLQLHVVSRGELARQGVLLFFEQVFDRFPNAGESCAKHLLLTLFIHLNARIAVQMVTELWNQPFRSNVRF